MIKITAVSYNNQTSLEPLSAVFGRNGGTLGRSEDNDFVLPDPKHFVSRVQASIKSNGTRHTIANLSKANPILLNGQELDCEQEYPLKAGDEIQIGLYLLRAEPLLTAVEETSVTHQNTDTPEEAIQGQGQASNAPATSRQNSAPRSAAVPTRAAPNLAELHHKKAAADPVHPGGEPEPIPANAEHENAMPPTAANAVDSQTLLQAFLSGAGVPHITLSSGLTPEFMEMLGKLLATSIQGTFELIGTRAVIKREVNADVTVVVVRNNNPLKFLSDSQTVLIQMLRKKMPGFLGPVEAMQEAYSDLHAHQKGMVAGMHAVIGDTLKHLSPQGIEQQLPSPSFVDSLIPAQRKAKMWDQYNGVFQDINRDAKSDFQTLFGKAFLIAYEKEIERAENARHE